MRAWQVRGLGEPRDVLTLDEVPDPEPGPGQLLVRVRGAAANFPDVLLCRGLYQIRPLLPFTPGIELCGEVVADGLIRPLVGQRLGLDDVASGLQQLAGGATVGRIVFMP